MSTADAPLTAAEISGEGAILPTWTHVDNVNVRTSRELWENMRLDGWNVEVSHIIHYYHVMLTSSSITGMYLFPFSYDVLTPYSIPISPDRPIEVFSLSLSYAGLKQPVAQDNYLDAYLRVIKDADPVKSALVFSCGMGAVRTTFAMVASLIVRRRMLLARGLDDPYAVKPSFLFPSGNLRQGSITPCISTVSGLIDQWLPRSLTLSTAKESGSTIHPEVFDSSNGPSYSPQRI